MENATVLQSPNYSVYPLYEVKQKFTVYTTAEQCLKGLGSLASLPLNSTEPYCKAVFDGVLCWPATPAMHTARQHCPPLQNLDTSMFGKRRCGPLGLWEGRNGAVDPTLPNGWTNYYECYPPEVLDIYNKIFGKENSELLKRIAQGIKLMEMIGLTVSLLCLLFSIFIFCYFRALRCDRTRIHRNLFVAISIHIAIQLIVNIDELIGQSTGSNVAGAMVDEIGMINNTPILCEVVRRIMIEYTKTVMFMWMFIEGMYLHNTLVISVFSRKPNYILFYCLGWGFPALLTITWAIPTGILDKQECWFGYTFRPLFWIIEGPRALIILVNLGFLLNIIRVLVTKLQDSNSTEALKVRKAVKAAIVLLPLLGFNNSLALVEAPTESGVKFAVFNVVYVFLISFQGFFIALIYCFLNGEVQSTISRHWMSGGYSTTNTRDSGVTTLTGSGRDPTPNTNVRRTLSKKWDLFLVRHGYRSDSRSNRRRSEATTSYHLNDQPLGRLINVDDYQKSPVIDERIDAQEEENRRESNDSGIEHDDTLKTYVFTNGDAYQHQNICPLA